MFHMLILICAVTLPREECQPYRPEVELIHGPNVENELGCGFGGQAYLARLGVVVRQDEYVKFRCVRTTIGAGNVG